MHVKVDVLDLGRHLQQVDLCSHGLQFLQDLQALGRGQAGQGGQLEGVETRQIDVFGG